MKSITQRQKEIFNYICEFTNENFYQPSIRQIGIHFGVSPAGLYSGINALVKKGYMKKDKAGSSGYFIPKEIRQGLK